MEKYSQDVPEAGISYQKVGIKNQRECLCDPRGAEPKSSITSPRLRVPCAEPEASTISRIRVPAGVRVVGAYPCALLVGRSLEPGALPDALTTSHHS